MTTVRSLSLRARVALVAGALVTTVAMFSFGWFEPIEDRLTAARASLLDSAPTGQVAVVEIDARSLARLHHWPWSRHYHAGVVERLHAAGANLIAFDVDFSAPSEASGDAAFANAIRQAQPVILPIFQQRASDQATASSAIESKPATVFETAWVGGVNIFPGIDGVVRDYPAATMIAGHIRPSISALLAENDTLGDRVFQPDWAIDVRKIPRFSFVDVLAGRIPARDLAGKRIIIGATAIELGDHYVVPRFGSIPGVVIQALAADSLIQGRALMRTGWLPTLVAAALVALVLGLGVYRRFRYSFSAAALAVVSVTLALPIALQSRWPVSIDSAPVLFVALVVTAARVAFELRRQLVLRALLDSETKLPNRQSLEIALAASVKDPCVLAAAGLERFELIRDALGMAAVTDMVKEIAARIEAAIDGPVYRIAPDVVAWCQPAEEDAAIAARVVAITQGFRQPVSTSAGLVDVGLTVGLDRDGGAGLVVLRIEHALAAIGTARAAGDLCHWYQGADPTVRRKVSLMGELRNGLAAGDVTVFYQPKLDLRRNLIADAEALVRWYHPTQGNISPDEFIPLAETTGVISEVTDYVLRTALNDCARWQGMGTPMRVAINASAGDIANAHFADKIKSLLHDFGLPPSAIAIEITESALIRSPDVAIFVLKSLREFGVRLSIDDYGTGLSTLSYLKQLPVHELKIDKSFVTSLCQKNSDSDTIMVRSTINLAHDLGLQVVAEGIEDQATIDLLRTFGCDYAQGYFIGKPMPFDALTQLVNHRAEPVRLIA
ncbi:EAL domain-containing protein [Sphingomonas sp.]|uniref:EAL domain-containing protein n=1 Tax=Sphingomonas sp. TaxID=28214 RepID=UPI0025F62692|nr:EAL domain-containing protein [Sphingomonas sp.]